MEWMLFDHAKYDKMYNCSFLSYEEWASLGHVSIPMGCWCSTCATVLLLAFNRLLDLSMPHLSDSIFHGKRIFVWLLIPICYGLYYWWFSCPCLYNSNFYACFLDPYFGLSIDHPTDVVYANFLFSINNIAIIVALGTVYIAIICALIAKTRFANSKSVSAIQRQMIFRTKTETKVTALTNTSSRNTKTAAVTVTRH
uniref:Uncharacterized protein n=1 Tax=Acrobeloides nanus TaxID=290746 RepID=A0A914ELJ6_9BILA